MIIKRIQLTLTATVLLLLSNFTNAQELELTWGKDAKAEKENTILKDLLSSDENGYSFVFGPEYPNAFAKTYQVIRNNIQHEKESSILIPEKLRSKNVTPQATFSINNKLVAFLSVVDTKTETNQLYCVTFGENNKIITDKLVDEIRYKDNKNNGKFDIRYNKDQKSFMLMHQEVFTKNGNVEVSFKLYKDDFTSILEKNITLPYLDKQFEILDYQTDESNNIFLLGNYTLEKNVIKKTIFSYNHQSNKLDEIYLNFKTIAKGPNLKFTYEYGSLNLTGFYYTEANGIQGLCFVKINAKTLQTELEKLVPFSKNDLLQFITEKDVEKNTGVDGKFVIREIIKKENGDQFIIAEYYNFEVRSSSEGGYRAYDYRDIMVVSVKKDLEINWTRKINKHQYSRDDDGKYSSFATLSDDKNIYLIYNDHKNNHYSSNKKGEWRNVDIQTDESSKIVITSVTLNQQSGEFKREHLYKPINTDNARFVPKQSYRIINNQLLMYGQSGSDFKFGILTIK